MAERGVFEVPEIEPLVLDDGPADACTYTVLIISRVLRNSLSNKFLIDGVQLPVLKILVKRSVETVRAALHDNIELPAGRMTELGIVIVLQNREFSGGVCGDIDKGACHVLSIVIDTFNHKVIVHRTLTAYGRSGSLSNTAIAGHTRAQHRQVQGPVEVSCRLDDRDANNVICVERRLEL